jgi:hypothetical protein
MKINTQTFEKNTLISKNENILPVVHLSPVHPVIHAHVN